MAIPGIPVDPRSQVYKRICDQLRTDPVIGSRVEWICWDGARKDVIAVATDKPTVETSVKSEGQTWAAPDAFRGMLGVEIILYIPNSYDATDGLDLWGAIERALYPQNKRDKQLAFEQQLRDAGAETGEIELSQPAAITPVPTDDGSGFAAAFVGRGAIRLPILRATNP